MKKFEILDHRADIKIRVLGRTPKEVFLNSLLAMESILDPDSSLEQVTRNIEVESIDLPALLVDFLNEALFLGQTNKESYQEFEIYELSKTKIKGKFKGKKVKSFNEDIKAATYHDLKFIQKNDKIWEATIIFDV